MPRATQHPNRASLSASSLGKPQRPSNQCIHAAALSLLFLLAIALPLTPTGVLAHDTTSARGVKRALLMHT